MSVLHPPATSTRQFSWDPDDRLLTSEISSTNGFGRVYDDACDFGLTITSASTGHEVVFVIDHEERLDGEVRYWLLKPAAPSKSLGNIRVMLFND